MLSKLELNYCSLFGHTIVINVMVLSYCLVHRELHTTQVGAD